MNDFWVALVAALLLTAAAVTLGRHIARGLDPADKRVIATGLGVAALGTVAFLVLARAWQAPLAWSPDAWAAEAARRAWSDTGAAWFGALTRLGDRETLWALGLVGGIALLWRREFAAAVTWIVVLLGNAAWVPLLKAGYERVRPEADLSGVVVSGNSFPSGHTSGAMVVYGLLAWVLCRRLPARWRLPVLLASAAVIVVVGASRVYLQAHFLSDVLGGMASGGAWLALGIAAALAWKRRHPHAPL